MGMDRQREEKDGNLQMMETILGKFKAGERETETNGTGREMLGDLFPPPEGSGEEARGLRPRLGL